MGKEKSRGVTPAGLGFETTIMHVMCNTYLLGSFT